MCYFGREGCIFYSMKKLGAIIIFILVSAASASGISWKTFDVKTGPLLGGWLESSTSIGWSLSLVKPLTPYLGVGAMIEVATSHSMCCDCAEYDFDELSEGLLVNFDAPLAYGFNLVANFMFLLHWEEGTVSGLYFSWRVEEDLYDADGEPVYGLYRMEEDNNDYDFESFMFRSNLGVAWRTSGGRFGLELYPLDFALVRGGDARYTMSLNAVVRVF